MINDFRPRHSKTRRPIRRRVRQQSSPYQSSLWPRSQFSSRLSKQGTSFQPKPLYQRLSRQSSLSPRSSQSPLIEQPSASRKQFRSSSSPQSSPSRRRLHFGQIRSSPFLSSQPLPSHSSTFAPRHHRNRIKAHKVQKVETKRLTPAKSSPLLAISPQSHSVPVALLRSRLTMVWAILILGIVGLMGNLVRLQVFEADKLKAMAEKQHDISIKPFMPRRPIIDRNGDTLAIDRQEYILYAHPIGFKDPSQEHKRYIAEQLAPILNQKPSKIVEKLNLRESGINLQTGVTEDEAKRIRALLIDGLDLSSYQARFYPYGSLFAHIVGYTNIDHEGQVGVEHSRADLLSYSVPTLNLKRTAYGALMPGGVPEDFRYHEHLNLKLTVDGRLQRRIRALLRDEILRLSAERGLAIVMEVNTGAIRAMVTEPTYDPNGVHTTSDIPRMVNSAISHLYEPGSTFKPINVAIALESARLHPNDIIYDSGQITMGTWSIGNHDFQTRGARGSLTISDVMKYSSNVGMIRIMQKLDREQYYDWLGILGLGQLTGIDLPFEASALVKSRKQFTESAVESATTAFGQGFSVTPLQLIQMQAALGNGGNLVTPHVIDGLVDHSGKQYWRSEQPAHQSVFSKETTRVVLDMMETVVTDGTGKAAQVPGYRIAGKTGTAQKAGNRGVYEDHAKVTSFVSLFPANNPQFALLVLVDEPKGRDTYGGTVAAPIAQDIIESVISLENLPPE